jgi:hypothetical protein
VEDAAREGPSIRPLRAGWTRMSRNDWLRMGPGDTLAGALALMARFLFWLPADS